MAKTTTSELYGLGDSLAVRIPSAVVKCDGPKTGQPVEPSLAEKLALFDPERHGGEAMATERIGQEVF